MLAWLKQLVTPSETPLKALENDQVTAEGLIAALQAVQADNVALRFEWGEMLDKLTRVAARENARQRMRAKRELGDDEGPDAESAPHVIIAAPPQEPVRYDPRNKADIRRFIRAGGA